MKWSTNISEIKQQRYLWEKKIAKKGYIQLPYGFKAFDFYRAGEAISAKTINTLSACYTKNRNLIKYVINKYVKSMINFKQYTKCGITIHNDDIIKKKLFIGIPTSLDKSIIKAINDSASKNNVAIKIFRIYS